jgi:diadenosine tetraphosphate (Ap4A) HIT family hydrolase
LRKPYRQRSFVLDHTLVFSRRHEVDFFRLEASEQSAIWNLAPAVRDRLIQELHPDTFNAGIDAGAAAGQTVVHAHLHVIPRHTGDAPDPHGGVRRVLPEKARYWA